MTNPDFVFFTSKELSGIEYILEMTPPNEIFRAFKFEKDEDFEKFIIKYNLLNECIVVPGYRIVIAQVGNLESFTSSPVLGHNITDQTKKTFTHLIKFYVNERINGNESRLKKVARP